MTSNSSPQERIAAQRQFDAARKEAGERKRMGERESLYRDFFSLGDVVQMVANCIDIADGELDPVVQRREEQDDVAALEARAAATWRKQLLRTSRAAEILGVNIANTASGHRLRWLDLTRGSGDAHWQNVEARTEGLALLSDMAKWERVVREELHRQDRLVGSRWSIAQPEPAPQFLDLPTIPRIRLIGFDPDELTGFLLDAQIPSSLVTPLPGIRSVAGNGDSRQDMSESATVDQVVAGEEPAAPSVLNGEKPPKAKSAGPRPPMKMPENRDYLSTEEFAAVMGVQPNTILKARHKLGHYCGIRALKLPENRLLRWPAADIKAVLARRTRTNADTEKDE